MGKFFNAVLMNKRGGFPANLEPLRKQFNEEQANARRIDNPPEPKESPVSIEGSRQNEPDIPARPDGEGGARPVSEGDTSKGRGYKRSGSPSGDRKSGTGLRGKGKGRRGKGRGKKAVAPALPEGSNANPTGVQPLDSGVPASSNTV